MQTYVVHKKFVYVCMYVCMYVSQVPYDIERKDRVGYLCGKGVP